MAKPVWIVRWDGNATSGSPATAMTLALRGIVSAVRSQNATYDFYCPADTEGEAVGVAQTYAAGAGITLVGSAPTSVVNMSAPPP